MSNPNQLIDAVKTATSIHKGDYSSLRGKSFVIRDNIKKKRRGTHVKKHIDKKMTLTKLAKQMNARFDSLESDVKDIKIRLDKVETRLDYIVKANNLKDLARNKSKS